MVSTWAALNYGGDHDDDEFDERFYWPEEIPPDVDDFEPANSVDDGPTNSVEPSKQRPDVDSEPLRDSRRNSVDDGPKRRNPAADDVEDDPLLRLRNFGWLDRQEFPPLQWAVPGLITEGLTLLAGRPKAGKSWLALQVALAAACGGRALGAIDVGPPRPVLLLALEDGDRRLQARARHLMEGGGPLPERLHYLTDVPPRRVVDTIRRWLAGAIGDGPSLVVLDTLGRVLPPAGFGQSSYERDYQVIAALKRVVDERPGTSMIAVHHTRKADANDFVDHVSGTAGLTGAADAVIVLSRPRGEDRGLLRVTGRDVEEREVAVVCEQGRWRLLGGDLAEAEQAAERLQAEQRLGDRSTEILRIVADQPQGVRAVDIATALGVDEDTAGRYLRRLAQRGDLQRTGRGVYTGVRSVRSSGSGDTVPDTSDTPDGPDAPDGSDTSHRGPEHQRGDADRTRRSDTSDTPDTTHRGPKPSTSTCERCGLTLDPVLVDLGLRTHPTCEGW